MLQDAGDPDKKIVHLRYFQFEVSDFVDKYSSDNMIKARERPT